MSLEDSDAIAAKGAIAPRVTLEGMKRKITSAEYLHHGLLTICILTLKNGFTVTGESACAAPENYDREKGEHFAYEAAIKALWPLEGYLLRETLANAGTDQMPFGDAVEMLKIGLKVTRAGWNGKGMWLYYVHANSYPAQTEAARGEFGDMVPYQAYIAMKTAQGTVVPWLCSQSDMLAEDWEVVS